VSATYVFCLVKSTRAPSTRGAPPGVPGAGSPRTLEIDRGLWAIVADAPLDRFSGEQLQHELQDLEALSRHALAHASIVEFFFRRAPVVPLKLFTLFSADDRARQYLRGRKTQLHRLLEELRGLEEWGVRITSKVADPGLGAVESDQSAASGRDYLHAKIRLRNEGAQPPRAAMNEAKAALKSLSRLASKRRPDRFPPAGKGRAYVTGASFLVKASRRGQWRKRTAQVAASLEQRGHRFEMSGPWPPYRFVSPGAVGSRR